MKVHDLVPEGLLWHIAAALMWNDHLKDLSVADARWLATDIGFSVHLWAAEQPVGTPIALLELSPAEGSCGAEVLRMVRLSEYLHGLNDWQRTTVWVDVFQAINRWHNSLSRSTV